jgi:hypothetical protein
MIYKLIFDKIFNDDDDDDYLRLPHLETIKVFGLGLESGINSVFDKYDNVELDDEILLDIDIDEDVIKFGMAFVTDEDDEKELYGTIDVNLKLSTFELKSTSSYIN